MDVKALTPAQQRILAEVRRDGRRVYNGRALAPIKALVAAGLVVADFDMDMHAKGNGTELAWRITVTPPADPT